VRKVPQKLEEFLIKVWKLPFVVEELFQVIKLLFVPVSVGSLSSQSPWKFPLFVLNRPLNGHGLNRENSSRDHFQIYHQLKRRTIYEQSRVYTHPDQFDLASCLSGLSKKIGERLEMNVDRLKSHCSTMALLRVNYPGMVVVFSSILWFCNSRIIFITDTLA
jgi:hypothetical protein